MQVALAFDGASHGRVFLVGMSNKFHRFTPMTFVSHFIIHQAKVIQIDMPVILIFFQQKFVILLTHVIIGNTQHQIVAPSSSDGKHTVIKEQTGKNLRLGDINSGKGSRQCGDNLPLFGDFAQHTFAVPVQFVQSDQFLHFVIIRAGVRVNHLLGRLS